MIACFHGRSPLSWAIRLRTWSDVTHVEWVCPDYAVVGAWLGGVNVNMEADLLSNLSKGHTPGTKVDLYYIDGMTCAEQWIMSDAMKAEKGKPYDFMGILGFMVAKDIEDRKKWFCSELVDAKLNVSGVRLFNLPSHKVFPGMFPSSPRLRLFKTVYTARLARQ